MTSDLNEAVREWSVRNKVLDRVRDVFFLRAREYGGDEEANKAASSLQQLIIMSEADLRKLANELDEKGCEGYLIRIRQGVYDFHRTRKEEIDLIMGR